MFKYDSVGGSTFSLNVTVYSNYFKLVREGNTLYCKSLIIEPQLRVGQLQTSEKISWHVPEQTRRFHIRAISKNLKLGGRLYNNLGVGSIIIDKCLGWHNVHETQIFNNKQ